MTEKQSPQAEHALSRAWRQFRRNRLAVFGLVMLLLLGLVALFAPYLAPHDPTKMRLDKAFLPPGTPGHLLGTDELGMDMLSRLIFGARISLRIALIVAFASALFGSAMGALAGYYGGMVDVLISRTVDIFYSFPFFILVIAIMAILGPSLGNVMIALAIVTWVHYARLVRGEFLGLKEKEFVEAAKASGATDIYIIVRCMMPNALAPVFIMATLGSAGVILNAAGLSFLGLGAQPPTPEWGAMINQARPYLRSYPYLSIFPGLAVMLTVLSLNFVGDGLRDALDPKMNL